MPHHAEENRGLVEKLLQVTRLNIEGDQGYGVQYYMVFGVVFIVVGLGYLIPAALTGAHTLVIVAILLSGPGLGAVFILTAVRRARKARQAAE